MKRVYCWNCKYPELSVQCEESLKEWAKRSNIKLKRGEWYMLNKDNDCIFYVRKWWKVWVR